MSDQNTTVVLGANAVKAENLAEADIGVTSGSDAAKASKLQPLLKVEGDRSAILSFELMQLPAGELSQLGEIGFVNAPPGRDGIRRMLPLVVRVGYMVYPSLSLKSLMEFWNAKPEEVTVRLGDAVIVETPTVHQRIPINKKGEFLINYRHLADGCNGADYGILSKNLYLRYVQGEEVLTPDLQGRILLVGQVAEGLSDFGPSPLAALTPLVLVHANVIGNVLEGDYARRVPAAPIWLGAFALGLVGLMAFSKRELRDPVIYALGVPTAYYGAAYYSWERWSLWLPLVGPMLGFVGLQIADLVRRVSDEQRAK
jgi:adenylate cyclase